MLGIKKYFIKRREQRERRASFRLKRKTQKKIDAIKANLWQEENKGIKKWLVANRSIRKLF